MIDSMKALLIDLDCPMDDSEFESVFQKKLGISLKDFYNAFLDAPDPSSSGLFENNSAVEEKLKRGFASLDLENAEEVLDPCSPLMQQVLGNLLRLPTGKRPPRPRNTPRCSHGCCGISCLKTSTLSSFWK